MKYDDLLLDELHDVIYGNGNEPYVDYEERTINYNECGDIYYYINTYSNDEVKSIVIGAKNKNENDKRFTMGYRKISIEDEDDFYSTLDYISENLEEIENCIVEQIERTYNSNR